MRVQLARMEGKLDLSNLRHQRSEERLEDHGKRITGIESREHVREGQLKGVTATIKSAWLAGGALVTAFALAVLKKMGLI